MRVAPLLVAGDAEKKLVEDAHQANGAWVALDKLMKGEPYTFYHPEEVSRRSAMPSEREASPLPTT